MYKKDLYSPKILNKIEEKMKLYIETSVLNFLFADDVPEKKKITEKFFEKELNKYKA